MKQLRHPLTAFLVICFSGLSWAQESEKIDTLNQLDQRVTNIEDQLTTSKKLRISGYIQSEWQMSQIDDNGNMSFDVKSGAGLNASEKTFASGKYINRFGVRRGRLKATYSDHGCVGVVYLDALEKGVVVREAYGAALDPWTNMFTIKTGIFNRPFGYEIEYSSSQRESPERSRIIQTLMPSERDLGAMITFQTPKGTAFNPFKVDFGVLAGNAIGLDNKSKKDLISRINYSNANNFMKYGFGASYYYGHVLQPSNVVYSMQNNVFVADSSASNKNSYSKRKYMGIDAQISINSAIGTTTLRSEFLWGQQPGSDSKTSSNDFSISPSKDPSSSTTSSTTTTITENANGTFTSKSTTTSSTTTTLASNANVITKDTYLRKFRGGYLQLVQDIADTKHTVTLKFDWYDPNTAVAGNNIGINTTSSKQYKTNKADIAYYTLGMGYLYRMNSNVKFMVYYDIPFNETSSNLVQTFNSDGSKKGTDFSKRLAANLLTVRLQYKF